MVLILSFQVLPLVQAGNNWYQNQLTEELPGNDDMPIESVFSTDEISNYISHSAVNQFNTHVVTLRVYYIHNAALSVLYPVMDVQTPPPDCI
jgi:hypothetical protein